MLLRTHTAFTLGLLIAMLKMLNGLSLTMAVLAALIAYIVNLALDRLGHVKRGAVYVRSPLTHDICLSALWGLVISAAFTYASMLFNIQVYPIEAVLMGPIGGLSHMLLDSLTEEGVYVRRRGTWRRVSIAHFRYNNPALNWLFTAIGLALMAIPLIYR